VRPRGFTLIELTVVLLIIGISTALVVPAIDSGITSREVRRAARQIASTMLHVRGEALARGRPMAMLIDVPENTIETVGGGRWAELTERAVIEGVGGGAREVGDRQFEVRFFPNGSTSGAAVVLSSRVDRTRNRLLVELDPLIGSVRVGDASS
jgi:general secretion pathway protein H